MFARLTSFFKPSLLTEASAAQYVRDHFAQYGETTRIHGFDHSERGMIQVEFSTHSADGLRNSDGTFAVWISDDGAPHLYGEW